jgi:hypothetical protein
VQFVDHGSKLISSTYEIYKSSTGSSRNHVHLEGIAMSLLELSHNLEYPDLGHPRGHDKPLHELSKECIRDSETLIDLIKALRAKNNSRWSSFQKAMKSAWKEEQIDRLEEHLRGHRSEIGIQLVAMLG